MNILENRIEILEDKAEEQGSYLIELEFLDENENSVVPTEATWTLTNTDGDIINSRIDVTIILASTAYIVLNDDDLAIDDNENNEDDVLRIITVNAKYDSVLASGLNLKKEFGFYITNFLNIEV